MNLHKKFKNKFSFIFDKKKIGLKFFLKKKKAKKVTFFTKKNHNYLRKSDKLYL